MARTFFGFALADSMFEGDCVVTRKVVDVAFVREKAAGLIPCLNPSHQATIDAMRRRFGIEIAVPDAPPKVALSPGDAVIVMGVPKGGPGNDFAAYAALFIGLREAVAMCSAIRPAPSIKRYRLEVKPTAAITHTLTSSPP